MEAQKRSAGTFILALALVAAPTLLALGYYHLTGDPTFRPLSVTFERLLQANNARDGSAIVASVDWPPGTLTDAARSEAQSVILRAFGTVGPQSVLVVSQERGGLRGPTVTYLVGNNRIGPYPLMQAASGIAPAMSAFRMRSGRP